MGVLFLLWVPFTFCSAQREAGVIRNIYVKEFEWRITIPKGFERMPDTALTRAQTNGANLMGKTYHVKVVNLARTFFVFKSGQANSIEANVQPFDPSKGVPYEKSSKRVCEVIYGTMKAQIPNAKIDSSYKWEVVGGKDFMVFVMNVRFNERATYHILMYSRLFGEKKDFTVNICYMDAEKGKQLLDAWKTSSFKDN